MDTAPFVIGLAAALAIFPAPVRIFGRVVFAAIAFTVLLPPEADLFPLEAVSFPPEAVSFPPEANATQLLGSAASSGVLGSAQLFESQMVFSLFGGVAAGGLLSAVGYFAALFGSWSAGLIIEQSPVEQSALAAQFNRYIELIVSSFLVILLLDSGAIWGVLLVDTSQLTLNLQATFLPHFVGVCGVVFRFALVSATFALAVNLGVNLVTAAIARIGQSYALVDHAPALRICSYLFIFAAISIPIASQLHGLFKQLVRMLVGV